MYETVLCDLGSLLIFAIKKRVGGRGARKRAAIVKSFLTEVYIAEYVSCDHPL